MHLGQYRRYLDSLFPRNSNLETNLGCDPILSPRGHEVAERLNGAVLGWYRQSDAGLPLRANITELLFVP